MYVSMQSVFDTPRVSWTIAHMFVICHCRAGLLHKMQRAVFLETDTPEILAEAIKVVRKGGTIAVIGD